METGRLDALAKTRLAAITRRALLRRFGLSSLFGLVITRLRTTLASAQATPATISPANGEWP